MLTKLSKNPIQSHTHIQSKKSTEIQRETEREREREREMRSTRCINEYHLQVMLTKLSKKILYNPTHTSKKSTEIQRERLRERERERFPKIQKSYTIQDGTLSLVRETCHPKIICTTHMAIQKIYRDTEIERSEREREREMQGSSQDVSMSTSAGDGTLSLVRDGSHIQLR